MASASLQNQLRGQAACQGETGPFLENGTDAVSFPGVIQGNVSSLLGLISSQLDSKPPVSEVT